MSARPFGLSREQVRVLGSLAEKAATTPDAYPLSTNALRTACNQRSSREPVADYDEDTVMAALLALRERGLAKTIRGAGSRVYKHAHRLHEALQLDEAHVAVVAVLALRGPQTVGEIKGHTERQYRFGDLEEVQETLRDLSNLDDPLVERLDREPGKKEARWRQLLDAGAAPTTQPPPLEPSARPAKLDEESDARAATLEEITARIQRLEQSLEEIRRQLGAP